METMAMPVLGGLGSNYHLLVEVVVLFLSRPGDAHSPKAGRHAGGIEALNAVGVRVEFDRAIHSRGRGAVQFDASPNFVARLVGRQRNGNAPRGRIVSDRSLASRAPGALDPINPALELKLLFIVIGADQIDLLRHGHYDQAHGAGEEHREGNDNTQRPGVARGSHTGAYLAVSSRGPMNPVLSVSRRRPWE